MASSSNALDAESRRLINQIVEHFKCQGNFDELRRDCLDELDKMEAFRQLNQRVESYVATFLSKQQWSDSLPKNQVRDSLRKHVYQSEALRTGVERLISQALERKKKSFQMRIEGVVQNYLYTQNEKERQSNWRSRPGNSESRGEPERSVTDTKISAISDISDIISQIPGLQEPATSKNEATTSKTQSSFTPQKGDHSRHEKKGESLLIVATDLQKAGGSAIKQSPGIRRSAQGKRLAHKGGSSPNVGSPTESREKGAKHATESGARLKLLSGKGSYSPNIETPPEKSSTSGVLMCKEETISTKVKEEQTKGSTSQHASRSLQEFTCINADQQPSTSFGKDIDVPTRISAEFKQGPVTVEYQKQKEQKKQTQDAVAMERLSSQVPSTLKSDLKVDCKETESLMELDKIAEKLRADEEITILPKAPDVHVDTEVCPKKEMANNSDEDSDVSDISDVSSVHTSDLSSFDGEVSSISGDEGQVRSDDSDLEGLQDTRARGGEVEYSKDNEAVRRSRRISSRRSTKEDDDLSDGEDKSVQAEKQAQDKPSEVLKLVVAPAKRRRGRPRKEEKRTHRTSGEKKQQIRQARARHRKEIGANDSSDGNGIHIRQRSKRKIKRKRYYSPSSESTREVCLPSKRSRTGSKD